MAKAIDTKTSVTSAPVANNSQTLTVVVLDQKGQPTQGANVSITPSNASGVTNNSGEIQFTLGGATKYDVTATADGKTVTVPYYVTQGGATRLVVNPVYIKSVEAQLHPSFFNSNLVSTIGISLGIIIVLVIFWKFLHRKK
ncbi:MAG: hypothetical protein WCJ39_08100 [bacterium]